MSSSEQHGDTAADSNQINLVIKDPQGQETHVRVRRTTRLRKLFDAFCKKSNTDANTLRFFFQGARINDEETADDLNLKEGDVIDAFVRQVAGSLL